MKSIEDFFRQNLTSAACTSRSSSAATLPEEVRQAAHRCWHIFPDVPLSKMTGDRNLLMGEATSDLDLLTELAATYPECSWRVAAGPPSLCILELNGAEGNTAFTSFSPEDGECLALQAQRGDTAWAFFSWPKGLVLRNTGKELAPGMSILGREASCVVSPSGGSFYLNPWADPKQCPAGCANSRSRLWRFRLGISMIVNCVSCGLRQVVLRSDVCRRCRAPLGATIFVISLSDNPPSGRGRNQLSLPFGSVMRSMRLRQGRTELQVARSAHVGRSDLSRIERNVLTPNVETALRLLRA